MRLDGLSANTRRLSLLPVLPAGEPSQRPAGSGDLMVLLSRLLPAGVALQGDAITIGTAQLANYALSISADKCIGIKLAKGRLLLDGSGFSGWEDRLSAHLRGEAQFALQPTTFLNGGKLAWLDLAQLHLLVADAVIGAPGDRYRIASLEVNAAAVPILRDGVLLNIAQADALFGVIGNVRLSLAAENITHDSEGDPIEALSATLEGRGRSLLLTAAELRVAGTVLSATAEVALKSSRPTWHLAMNSSGVSVQELADLADLPLTPVGRLVVDLKLSGEGLEAEQLSHTLAGSLILASDGIELLDLDLDKLLTHLQYTQHGNLLDIALFLLIGPAGSLIMAASDFSDIVETAEAQGSSRIQALRSEVHFKQGMLHVDEAALSTTNHRLAIQGSLSVYDDGPVNLTIATVDSHGCTLFREQISGTLDEPEISNGGVLAKVLVQPLKTLASELLPGKRCIEPFYAGSVPAPAKE